MWRHIAQSLQGPSHVADGTACQDSNVVRLFGDGATETLVACIADGAGSAKFSDTGATIACNAVLENAATHFEANGRFDDLERDDVLRWCDDARTRIKNEAAARECNCRELATTLCVVIAAPDCSVFFQIGDGAIIVGNNGIYGVVFWPQSGEYANSTNFLTADDFRDRLDFLTTTSCCSNIAMFTDGLERLALRFDSHTAHEPFFAPLFRVLQSANDLDGLNEGLRQFLASDSVQARSDDDKTLILASRHDSNDAA
ncbi:MAG: PP2C family serine/threonine-protein phosphatase [Pirellulales bacterium]